MAAKEYLIKALKKGKAWKGSYGEFQDYALVLKGVGEPVKLSLPQPVIEDPEVGDRLYGRLSEESAGGPGKDGRIYYKLKLEKRPEEDKRQRSIESQFATRLATEVWIAQGCQVDAYDNIEREAQHFLDIVSNLKGD